MSATETDTRWHQNQLDRAYERALTGRLLDQQLLEETMAAYAKVPRDAESMFLTREYREYAQPYSAVFSLAALWLRTGRTGMLQWEPDEQALYAARQEYIEQESEDLALTAAERAYWQQQEQQLEKPFRYAAHEGWYRTFDWLNTIGMLMMLFVTICLSGAFPEEHTRRTDQLVLSSRNGRTVLYRAKLLAGVSTALLGAGAMTALVFALALPLYGADGFGAPVQIAYGVCFLLYSGPLSVGQASLLGYVCVLAASVVYAAFILTLSELLRSATGTMAISVALMLAGMLFSIPVHLRALAQIWDWLPFGFLNIWRIVDMRTLTVFGQVWLSWQAVPVLYLLAAALLAAGGWLVYRRYQVTGR